MLREVFLYVGGDKMQRKPITRLFYEYIIDELQATDMSLNKFAKDFGISRNSLYKLMKERENYKELVVWSPVFEQILDAKRTSLSELINKYGEFEDD